MFSKTEILDEFISGWENWSDEFFENMYEELAIQLMHEWIEQFGDEEESVVSRFTSILASKFGLDAASLYNIYFETAKASE